MPVANKGRERPRELGLLEWLTITGLLCSLVLYVNQRLVSCGDGVDRDGVGYQLARMRADLEAVSGRGPHTAGSTLNEGFVRDYLIQQINDSILSAASPHVHVQLHEQVSGPGNFNRGPIIHTYNKIRNLIVHISPRQVDSIEAEKRSALLLNCHYDSAVGSPGASDVFAGCAVLLEVGRLLVSDTHANALALSDVILLFNGAEESILVASHAFVTQHPLAKRARAFINLEGAGTGGRALLFQTGPGEAGQLLVRTYARLTRRPFTNVRSQDLFQANLIPSDTDFRIFRDHGLIPGMDLAFVDEGYHYHTPHDTCDRVLDPCLANTVSDVFRWTQSLIADPEFAHIERLQVDPEVSDGLAKDFRRSRVSVQSGDQLIFYDLLAFTTITYSTKIQLMWHVFLILLLFASFWRFCNSKRQFGLVLVSQFIWLASSALLAWLLGLTMHTFGTRMSFYNYQFNVLGVYLTPQLLWCFVFQSLLTDRIAGPGESRIQPLHFIVANSTVTIALASVMLARGFSPFDLHVQLTVMLLPPWLFGQRKSASWLIHLMQLAGSVVLPVSGATGTLYFFIPLFGRSGSLAKPDVSAALCVFAFFCSPALMLAPLIRQTSKKDRQKLIFFLKQMTIAYLIMVTLTPFGFPYGETALSHVPASHPLSFRHQRFFVLNLKRRFHHETWDSKSIHKIDNVLTVQSLDTNGLHYLRPDEPCGPLCRIQRFSLPVNRTNYVEPLRNIACCNCISHNATCGTILRSGAPSSVYILQSSEDNLGSLPTPRIKTATKLLKSCQDGFICKNLTIEIGQGHTHAWMEITLPVGEASLRMSNFDLPGGSLHPYREDASWKSYLFTHINQADGPGSWTVPWTFWVELVQPSKILSTEVQFTFGDLIFDKALPFGNTHALKSLVATFPNWTVPVSCTGSIDFLATSL